MIIPYRIETDCRRLPVANWLVVALCVAAYLWMQSGADYDWLVLYGWDGIELVGHIFLHGGFVHLLGNIAFLWIIGNAVCATIGNLHYFLLFVGLGVAAGATQLSVIPLSPRSDPLNPH